MSAKPKAWHLPLCLASLLALPAAAADRALKPPAPEFPAGGVWINAKPLSLKLLRNKRALLVAFINAANINSLRTLPYLNAWFDRYALDGLMVIGVHTPDYDFQADPRSADKTLRRRGVEFPVVMDTDRAIWKGYGNDGWPAFYLLDHKGRLFFDRAGEGPYADMEETIRSALAQLPGPPPPRTDDPLPDPPSTECGGMTPEVAAGTDRGAPIAVVGGDGSMRTSMAYTHPEGSLGYVGSWTRGKQSLTLAAENKRRTARAHMVYRGARAYAVMHPGLKPQRVFILQNEVWLRGSSAGADIRYDDDEHSFILVDEPRLYEVANTPNDELVELTLIPEKKGFRLYGFSFSDRCLVEKP